MPGTGYTDYCLTCKAENFTELQMLKEICYFWCFGHEFGEDGYEHYQGFVQLHKRKTLGALKAVCATTHFEPRRGTVEQAWEYCRKDGDYTESDNAPWYPEEHQGERTDLRRFYEDIKSGTPLIPMYDKHAESMIRYRHAFGDVRGAFARSAARNPAAIHWLFGPSRTGKNSYVRAFAAARDLRVYDKDPTTEWWPDYDGEEIVQIDEITNKIYYSTLLRAGDSTTLVLPQKGTQCVFSSQYIFITSNIQPDDVYSADSDHSDRWNALLERAVFSRVTRTDEAGVSRLSRVSFTSRGVWTPTGDTKTFVVPIKQNASVWDDL